MGKAAYFIVVLVVVALATEAGVRGLGLAPPLPDAWIPYSTAPHLVWGPTPGSQVQGLAPTGEFRFDLQHNRWGFRDREHPLAKPAGSYRILGLGDSYTYGWGADFEETYLRRLELLLAESQPAARIEVVKAGVARFFPEPERMLLDTLGRELRPDLVIVGFIPNDVLDTCLGLDAVGVGADGALVNQPSANFGPVGLALYRHSHAARILLRAWSSANIFRRCGDFAAVYSDDGPYEAHWRQVEEEFERMAAIASELGARLLVVNIPDLPPWDERRAYPGRRLGNWAARQGIAFLDLLPAMRAAAAADPAPLYWARDPHCTPRGYATIAAAIASYLEASGWLPSGATAATDPPAG
ncbi:MAG: SGNH/GDSL hydrolase family protein [Gammaproteobacteria bacterium]|nr:SGNH/GDSL hydrolase family protein [Gammaproteobacteria bacterium]